MANVDIIENKEIGRLLLEAKAEQHEQEKLDEALNTQQAGTDEEQQAGTDEEQRPADTKKPPITDEQLNEMMTGSLSLLSNIVGNLVAPNWRIQPEEHLMIGEEGANAINHYFPNAKSYIGPFTGLLLAVAGVAVPRMQKGIPMRLEEQIEENEEEIKEPVQ